MTCTVAQKDSLSDFFLLKMSFEIQNAECYFTFAIFPIVFQEVTMQVFKKTNGKSNRTKIMFEFSVNQIGAIILFVIDANEKYCFALFTNWTA